MAWELTRGSVKTLMQRDIVTTHINHVICMISNKLPRAAGASKLTQTIHVKADALLTWGLSEYTK